MTTQLHEQLRRIVKLAQATNVIRNLMAELAETLQAPFVVVAGASGELFELYGNEAQEIDRGRALPDEVSRQLQKTDETTIITGAGTGIWARKFLAVPLMGAQGRIGTVLIPGIIDSDEATFLVECAALFISRSLEFTMLNEAAELNRKREAAHHAVKMLTHSESLAMKKIFEELVGTEGILIGSRIAAQCGITRSIIVNAIRKFESAGVIMSRSLGMRGTFIKVLNDQLPERVRQLRVAS